MSAWLCAYTSPTVFTENARHPHLLVLHIMRMRPEQEHDCMGQGVISRFKDSLFVPCFVPPVPIKQIQSNSMNHKNKEIISPMFPSNVGSITFLLSTEAILWMDGTTRDNDGSFTSNRRLFHDLLIRMQYSDESEPPEIPGTFPSEALPLHTPFPPFVFRRPLLLNIGQMQYAEEMLSALWRIGRKRIRNLLQRMELLGLIRIYPSRIASYMTFPCIEGWTLNDKGFIVNPYHTKRRDMT